MGRRGWTTELSPFLSERARSRAPQVLAYAALTGAAILVAPSGEVALLAGATGELDVERLGRVARGLGGGSRTVSFDEGTSCVHAGPICMDWILCIVSSVGVYPTQILDRLRRAAAVLALALVDGGAGRPPGGGDGAGGDVDQLFARSVPRRAN